MAARTLPNLALKAFFDIGEDGWDDEMSLNLLTLSVLAQGRVLSRVGALPGAPADGVVHILTTNDTINVRDDGAWIAFAPNEGWIVYDVNTGNYITYDGADWIDLDTGIPEAPVDGTPYVRQDAAWVPQDIGAGEEAIYRVGGFFTTTPTASEVVGLAVASDDFTLAAGLDGSAVSVGTNPTATFAVDVARQVAGAGAFTTIATISIATTGVVTLTTAGGTVKNIAAGDVLRFLAPAGVDDTVANVAWTLKGTVD